MWGKCKRMWGEVWKSVLGCGEVSERCSEVQSRCGEVCWGCGKGECRVV